MNIIKIKEAIADGNFDKASAQALTDAGYTPDDVKLTVAMQSIL